jgi:hypothetical protein
MIFNDENINEFTVEFLGVELRMNDSFMARLESGEEKVLTFDYAQIERSEGLVLLTLGFEDEDWQPVWDCQIEEIIGIL